jgi:6-phosphogluconolactonase
MSCPHLEVTTIRPDDYVKFVSSRIQDIANDAIASRGVFLLGVSGGSVIDVLAEGLPSLSTDWKSWRIFLCDERLVPSDDPESTYGAYVQKLLPKIPEFPRENFLQADTSLSSEESAKDYEKRLRQLWEAAGTNPNQVTYGMSDCLILGVGPDGHTCSLFPGHSVLDVKDSWVTYIEESPKPPPKRITLTYPFINKATHVLVLAKGLPKAMIVKDIQKGADLPIGRVNNPGGRLEWILDHLVV